jgi:aryl-alcohol dehydrogenase-like predicted oxidoreductase
VASRSSTPANLEANRPFLDLLAAVAEEKDATPVQVALAWLLAKKPWIVPIPGTRRVDHLEENLGAVNVTLSSAELANMDAALAKLQVHGERMDEKNMQVVE